jgi:hypothetical protein
MPNPALRALLERATTDAAFRAKLLADPALAGGLSRAQIEKLLGEMALLDGQLTDEVLDGVAGARSVGNLAGGTNEVAICTTV